MSNSIMRQALSRMHLREQAIAEQFQPAFVADMQQLAKADPEVEHEKFMARRADMCEAFGFGRTDQKKEFAFSNGVAIIPVAGTLINRFGGSWGNYITGYNFIRRQHSAAMMDDDVKLIVHDHNSNGGEAAGCFELSDEIFASRGTKPIIAVVDSNCYSASYALASAADKVIVTPSGGVGSIGVVAMHVDMSKMIEEAGVKITFIHSGDHKVDGNPYEPLSPQVKKDIQKGVDKSRDAFVKLVARNRGLDEKIVHDTEARTYRAEDALALGLIDAIAPPSSAVQSFIDESEVSDDSQPQLKTESTMTITPEQLAQASADARTAEKARMAGIINCEEAKGKEAMANHLAMNTDMSLEAAKGILAVTPAPAAAPAAAAPAPAPAPAAAPANKFQEAMDAGNHPNIRTEGGAAAAANGGELTEAQKREAAVKSILDSQAAFTGVEAGK